MKTIIQPENPNIPIYYKVVSSYNRRLYSALMFDGVGSRYEDVVRYQVGKWTFPVSRKPFGDKHDYRLSVFGSLLDAIDFVEQMLPCMVIDPRIYTCERLTDGNFTHERNDRWTTVYRTGGVRLLNKVRSI